MNSCADCGLFSWNALEIVDSQVAEEKFNRLNRRARLANWWNRLTGRPETLLSYDDIRSKSKRTAQLDRGVREIPVESIVGSLSRAGDYDRQFRPLNPALKKRWINVHVLSQSLGWKPIIVHKVGENYYVEDGHHRVSVARHSNRDYIEAQVFE